MGRPSHSRSLGIWANGMRVARWTLTARGETELQYDPAWVTADIGRPLSLSLPFTPENSPLKGPRVLHYFDNLLPDSDAIRRRVAERHHTGSTHAFDLLKAIGRDCVGAVQLLDDDAPPPVVNRVEATSMSEAEIAQHLVDAVRTPATLALRPEDDFRISLAGAQEKTALLWWQGRWQRPHGSTPTTHILKLPMGLVGGRGADFSTSVDNEWLCLQILQAYGLPVAQAEIATFGTQRVLVVERFDRRLAPTGDWLMRLPQEDFCQVAGVSPWQKYESDGGPGLGHLCTTLRQSVNAEADVRTVLMAQLLFWLLRAPDGHAKNFSIQLLPRGRFQLTRLYDVMSAYPVMGAGAGQWSAHDIRLAMALMGRNRHYRVQEIQRRHFNHTSRKLGVPEGAEALIAQVLTDTPRVIDTVRQSLPAGFHAEVADRILAGLAQAVAALARMPAD